jgi:hypothetical protein
MILLMIFEEEVIEFSIHNTIFNAAMVFHWLYNEP